MPVDLVVALDASVSGADFEVERDFLRELTSSLRIGLYDVRLGVLTYADRTMINQNLIDTNTEAYTDHLIDNMAVFGTERYRSNTYLCVIKIQYLLRTLDIPNPTILQYYNKCPHIQQEPFQYYIKNVY